MPLVRGSNPIWFEVDLTAHAFDDTFYLFVLTNVIPYIPAKVWQDPFGNVVWSNPIQFLANGTLPNNIFFDSTTAYRLEFRQGPTQADPLIYLVENYVPGSNGITPIDEASFSTDNQITNPQFALVNFATPFTLTSISTQVINVAPGWFLNLTGTGNVTLSQVLLNNSIVNPTNASYALRIQLSGSWTNAYLSQRFENNGILWSNTWVSSIIMALSNPGLQNISASLVDSQGHTLTSILSTTPLSENFVAYPGLGQILDSLDTDFPSPSVPAAYIEYQLKFLMPNSVDITLSSIQLVSSDVPLEFLYEQTTIERQIDQTFHYYQPQLNFKPVPSLLTAWDFSLNPAQFGNAISITTTPQYIWDQTICASALHTMTTSFVTTTGDFIVAPSSGLDAFYVLQYLKDAQALKTTFSNLAVNISAYCLDNPGVVARVYLFYSSGGGTIPILPTTIGTIAASGIFTLTAANWTEIPQISGQSFSGTLPLGFTEDVFFDLGFNGWDGRINFGSTANANFAIVVTFQIPTPIPRVVLSSISLTPGDIPTRPAPQSYDEVIRECQYYYETNADIGTNLAAGSTNGAIINNIQPGTVGSFNAYPLFLKVRYNTRKRRPVTPTFYAVDGTINTATIFVYQAGAFIIGSNAAIGNWTLADDGQNGFAMQPVNRTVALTPGIAGSPTIPGAEAIAAFNYIADARLGIIA